MRPMRSLALILITLAIISSPAIAQDVSSLVEGIDGGVYTSDPQGPSTSAVTSFLEFTGAVTIDFARDGFGRAVQRPDGVGAVVADAGFANGQTGNHVEARTHWVETATNNSGSPTNYTFDFLIAPAALRIMDYAGLSDTDPQRPDVHFVAAIRVNGGLVFEATAHLVGGTNGHVLTETGTSLGPVAVGGGSVFGYDFQAHAEVLDLGVVANGASITVEYEMIARVDTPGYEAGGRASIGDPFDLDGTPGFSGEIVPGGVVSNDEASWGRVKALYE